MLSVACDVMENMVANSNESSNHSMTEDILQDQSTATDSTILSEEDEDEIKCQEPQRQEITIISETDFELTENIIIKEDAILEQAAAITTTSGDDHSTLSPKQASVVIIRLGSPTPNQSNFEPLTTEDIIPCETSEDYSKIQENEPVEQVDLGEEETNKLNGHDKGLDHDAVDSPEDHDAIETLNENATKEVLDLASAVAQGHVDRWLKYKDETDPSHRLRSLCKKGDVEGVKQLLQSKEEKFDIDAISEEGWTCLHEIITHECQFTKVARILLEYGAKVNTRDLQGDTPLHSALLYHNSENISLLLDNGADTTIQNGCGRMPIHIADEVDTLRLLLDKGADIRGQDHLGNTALHYAIAAKDKDRVFLLLDRARKNQVDICNQQNKNGSSPLHLVSDPELANALLQAGADPSLTDLNLNTPLHLATKGRHKEVVRLMLKTEKTEIRQKNNHGKTPLSYAKDKEMRSILLGKKCDPVPPTTQATTLKKGSKKTIISAFSEELLSAILPDCTSPGILKKRKRSYIDADDESSKPKGPRLRFSEVNDYSGVEIVEMEEKRVKVAPIYKEPQFSSDDEQ